MAAVKRLQKILDLLAKRYEVEGKKGDLTELRDPFAVGAWYILGVHAKKNGQGRAYEALRRAKGITPGQLLDIAPEKLTTICQLAGPYDDKRAKDLYAYADEIEEKCGQDFAKIFKSSVTEARKFLEDELHRSRPFTDYVLLAGGGFPIFAVDLPVARVASRLGFGKMRSDKDFDKSYKEIQKALEAESPKEPDWIIRAHGLLHRHGVEVCKPAPNCEVCPLSDDCPYFKKNPPAPKVVPVKTDAATGQ
jgi:endonuclease III